MENKDNQKSKSKILFILCFALILIIMGCNYRISAKNTLLNMPDIGVPEDQLNQKIEIIAPMGWNKFKTQDSILLAMYAISQEIIIVNPNDTKVFIKNDDDWIEVKDKGVDNPSDFTYVLDPINGDNPLYTGSAFIRPEIPDQTKPVTLRIFVFGYISEDGVKTDQKVASYIDVKLKR